MWQATHGWPQLELAADIRDEYSGVGPRLEFVGLLLVQFSPVAAALWIYGLVRLLRVPALVRAQAAGVGVPRAGRRVPGDRRQGVLRRRRRARCCWRRARAGWRSGGSRRGLVVAGVVLALSAFVAWPAALPLLPERTFGAVGLRRAQRRPGGDDRLARARRHRRPGRRRQRRRRSSSPANYGEAGALEWYGSDVPVFSGHNGYAAWGPPAGVLTGPVVLVGYEGAPDWAVGCRTVARVDNGVDVDNEEQGGIVQVCDGPRARGPTVWAEVTPARRVTWLRPGDCCDCPAVRPHGRHRRISCVDARKFLHLSHSVLSPSIVQNVRCVPSMRRRAPCRPAPSRLRKEALP